MPQPPGAPGASNDPAPPPGGRGFGGGPGGTGGGTGEDPNAAIGPNTFRSPTTAVTAFLAAVRSKNKDRLAQTTARRAATEAEEKHRKIFAAIADQSISDDELDEMAKALEGYQVAYSIPALSSGRIGVVVTKGENTRMLQRTITTRKEKEGWKVLDISNMIEHKSGLPPMFKGGRSGGRRSN